MDTNNDNLLTPAINGQITVYLKEDLGFVDDVGSPVDIGTWDKTCRIATLYPNQTLLHYNLIIQVHCAVINGNNTTITTEGGSAISSTGYNELLITNFVLDTNLDSGSPPITTLVGITLYSSSCSLICNNTIKTSNIGIQLEYCNDCSIVGNTITSPNHHAPNLKYFSSINNNYCTCLLIEKNLIEVYELEPVVTDSSSLYIKGIECNFLSSSCIVNNTINITRNTVVTLQVQSFFDIIITGVHFNNSCLNNLLGDNSINLNLNSFDLNSQSTAGDSTFEYIGVLLSTNNANNNIDNNTINLNKNGFDLQVPNLIPRIFPILLKTNNSMNGINHNKLYQKTSGFTLSSPFIYNNIGGISLLTDNTGNILLCNLIQIIDNGITMLTSPSVSLLGIYFHMNNIKNMIKSCNILVKDNIRYSTQGSIEFALILFNRLNSSNQILCNTLTNSQGTAITLVEHNNLTIIHGNLIKDNLSYGVALSTSTDTNSSTITENCFINNLNYNLYISNGNPFNKILCNNFISNANLNAYDLSDPALPTCYNGNYWSDYSGTGPYVIPPLTHKDPNPSLTKLPLCCNLN